MGAVALPVPPVGMVYHVSGLPGAGVAVSAVAVVLMQYSTGVTTPGPAASSFTTTFTDDAAEVQLLMVTVTWYEPACASVALEIIGDAVLLVKPAGPVHEKVGRPGSVVPTFNCMSWPIQTGLLLETAGAGGGFGSDNVNGPTMFDGQLFNCTYTLP